MYHYIRLELYTSTPNVVPDELTFRQAITHVLIRLFGTTRAHTYIDVLVIGSMQTRIPQVQACIRVDKEDKDLVLAALSASTPIVGSMITGMSVVKDSSFLPDLAADNWGWIHSLDP